MLTSVPLLDFDPIAGAPYSSPLQVDTLINNQGNVAAVTDVTITAANTTAYTVTIGGRAVTITSDGSATTQEIRDALIAAILANPDVASLIVPTSGGAAILRLTERFAQNPAVSIAVGANLSAATITAHANGEPMPAGIAVTRGTPDAGCRLMVDANSVVLGVTTFAHAMFQGLRLPVEGDALFPPNSEIGVLRDGEVWVRVEEAVTPASAVHVRHTPNGANQQRGAFRASVDSNTAVAWTAASYKSSAPAGGLARLSVKRT